MSWTAQVKVEQGTLFKELIGKVNQLKPHGQDDDDLAKNTCDLASNALVDLLFGGVVMNKVLEDEDTLPCDLLITVSGHTDINASSNSLAIMISQVGPVEKAVEPPTTLTTE